MSPRRSYTGPLATVVVCSSLCLAGAAAIQGKAQPTWRAGTAVANITPSEKLWMGGYAARNRPAEGKEMELWVKVLAIEDSTGKRGVIVTSDLLGFPQSISLRVIPALKHKYALERDSIVLSGSHTHCGPVLRESAFDMYNLDAQQRSQLEKYAAELEFKLVEAVGVALSDLAPAQLSAGQGTTRFAVNRRNNLEKDVPELIATAGTKGPVDHSVPVLAVFLPGGGLKAVLFGYACHNTVMDYYKWSGDYAGFAQLALEKHHPNATAMFFMGCGGDQNPLPRRQVMLAERYGTMLASAVEEVLIAPLRKLEPELHTRLETIDLKLGDAPMEAELRSITSETNSPPTAQRWAKRLLAQIRDGKPLARSYPYPLQAWRFGERQLLVTMGGEPVVDYALKFKEEFGRDLWVAGYCNDVMGYIPSLRVLREDATPSPRPGWGYEGAQSMKPYGLPAWRWGEAVEDQITETVRRLIAQINSGAPGAARN